MFKDAKVGDRVWSIELGWGTVIDNGVGSVLSYPVQVKFDKKGLYHSYTSSGKWDVAFEKPTLFWDEVKIIPSPKPKRKVRKMVEGWVNIYPTSISRDNEYTLSPTEKRADERADIEERLGNAHFIRHEYEVEE